MVKRMTDDALITLEPSLELTGEGRHLAEVVVRGHRLAERFLSEVLGLPWVKVHAEAEVWEHVISDDVEAGMWEALDNPKTCPLGNPIPGAGYKPPPIEPLSTLDPGESKPLERISEELELDAEIMGFLDESGLRPGALLSVISAAPDGTLTVGVDDENRVGIGLFIAERLFVAIA
jgi:DtxR family Mn-dependent transcriptional regulator